MKVAIVAPSPIPFLIGGAEKFFWGLHRAINQFTPHDAELIKIPCRDQEFWPLMDAYQQFSSLDLSYFDMVITTKYPAWMVSHHNHHVYMQHTCRGVYDLYSSSELSVKFKTVHPQLEPICKMLENPAPDRSMLEPFLKELFQLRYVKGLPDNFLKFPGPFTRAVIRWLDSVAMSPECIKSYSSISRNVANREGYFPDGVDIQTIHHPTDLEGLHCSGYDYIFTASRLEGLKRIDLLIKAFKSVNADIEFRIAGTGGQEDRFKKIAAGDSRIRFLGFIQDDELVRQYAGALFVPFTPYDEDYGLITVEAMQSAKAVLTTTDSGGVKELVRHGINGMIVSPDEKSISAAMQELCSNRDNTIRMGVNAKESAAHINWRSTTERLFKNTERALKRGRQNSKRRKKIVVVNSYPVYPPLSGGQKRIYHLYKVLSQKADIVLLTLANSSTESKRIEISAGFKEIVTAMSSVHDSRDISLEKLLGASVRDISAIENYALSPSFINTLSSECLNADLVIASHPYLYYAIREIYKGRLWYDAHNVEYDMKSVILPDSEYRSKYLEMVRDVEGSCCSNADLILAVSGQDSARFQELYGIDKNKIVIVPNGMDFQQSRHNVISCEEKKKLKERLGIHENPAAVFIGSWHGPNIDALKTIRMAALKIPECLFFIIGSVCHHPDASEMPDNVKLLGIVSEDEKRVVFQASDIALNPVSNGGGSNLKLMEYIAYGLPVITFVHGIRGYELDAEDCFVIAEPENFSDALKNALKPERRPELDAMAEKAYVLASARYDWSNIAAKLFLWGQA